MFQLAEKQARNPPHEPQLDLRERASRDRSGVFAAAQQSVNDRIQDRGVDVEDQVAFQRFGSQQVEAGGILEAEHKLAVRKLIDARQLDFDDRAEQSRERRAEVAAKPLMQRL